MKKQAYKKQIEIASKKVKADLVLKNVRYLNVFTNEFLQADIAISDHVFAGIGSYEGIKEIDCTGLTMVPGFIDAHIHLESTTVRPSEFVKAAIPHGTTTVITDPHEIGNVLGTAGIDYMLQATDSLPMDIFFMLPSCVPSCPFDESGAVITSKDILSYLPHIRILGLAELMNVPGVLHCDKETLQKTRLTLEHKKRIDGHAPNLSGANLMAYVASGVYSDHECTTAEEAIEKIQAGQWIMIREGTASKNLHALLPLCKEPYASRSMFCTDDRHIHDIINEGHMDYIIKTAIQNGVAPETAYKMASFCAASYFGLSDRGAIAPGYLADFVLLKDASAVDIVAVYKSGEWMSETVLTKKCTSAIDPTLDRLVHDTIHISEVHPEDLLLKQPTAKVIGLLPEQLLTTDEGTASKIDLEHDILKVCVLERHKNTGHLGVCFLKGYGLTSGAIATTVAHDSHNIIAIGCSEEEIAFAINALHKEHGGMVVVRDGKLISSYSLPIAGLISDDDAFVAKQKLEQIHKDAYALGVHPGIDPFMTLSFVSLPVIPSLKLTTHGVVDVERFILV